MIVEQLDAGEQTLEEWPEDDEAGVVNVELVESRERASAGTLGWGGG
jgi:hypothetical protein